MQLQSKSAAQSTALARTLPYSRMKYPDSFFQQVKYIFWRLYTPFHPFFRDLLLKVGILSHEGRQHFLLGTIAPGYSIQDVVSYLIDKGYGNHFIAWRDEGEVVGLRYVENFMYQYHIRLFADGEIRAHYEYTPECYPILHLKEVGQEARREEFLAILGDKVIPQ